MVPLYLLHFLHLADSAAGLPWCRTLTPFGFQAEERTLWQAPETYQLMSPFNQANMIKKPLLLIHGEADNNAGARTTRRQASPVHQSSALLEWTVAAFQTDTIV